MSIVHDMLTRFYKAAGYIVLDTTPDLQAHRTDRFEGWVRQPAEIGPVLFSNSSPSYWNLTPIAAAADDSGLSSSALIAIALAGAIGVGARRLVRRQTAKRGGARVADTTVLRRTELDP